MKTGIYKITNIINNKFYIGSSSLNIKSRWRCHITELNKNKHRNIHLQRSWNKHGKNSFNFEVLEYCKADDCIIREQYYIDTLNPNFNIARIAGSNRGMKLSQKQIDFLVSINKGRPAWNKGIPFSKEVKEKMSRARLGKIPWNKGRSNEVLRNILRDDGKIYRSILEASIDLNVKRNTISKALTDKSMIRRVKGFVLKYI